MPKDTVVSGRLWKQLDPRGKEYGYIYYLKTIQHGDLKLRTFCGWGLQEREKCLGKMMDAVGDIAGEYFNANKIEVNKYSNFS